RTSDRAAVRQAVERKVAALQATYPGLEVGDRGERIWVTIPEKYRVGHEAHFGLLIRQFMQYVRNPKTLPAWEKPNMLSKYYVTTKGVELARQAGR
ncbi:oxidoreductase, partial [Candidatus Sumerlaeota bacterium]|nr:oxidoreductase [Candidatus Sumerlaeota bacterium]